jgi:hypothetical protein
MASSVRQDLDRAMADQQKRRDQQRPAQRQPARQLEKPKDGDILGKIAHPLAYAFDQAWGDISSPLPKEWEHETTVPPPDDLVSRTLGEGMRGLFDIGALFLTRKAGKKAVEKFVKPRIVKQVRSDLREQMRKKAKRKAKRDAAKPDASQPAAKPKPNERKPARTLPNTPVDIKKYGGGLDTEFRDIYGRKYKPISNGSNGRKRFRREDGVTVVEQDNGKFVPQRSSAK